MRFLFSIELDRTQKPIEAATVTLTCAEAPQWPGPLVRRIPLRDDSRKRLMPVPPDADLPLPGEVHAALAGGDTKQFHASLASFRARRIDAAKPFGRYLFAVLIGEEWWQRITGTIAATGDDLIELAIRCPAEEDYFALQRLPWEAMYRGDLPLVASHKPRVAVTRVVATAGKTGQPDETARPASPHPLDLPPRVLFVIGAALTDPKVRSAAEILGVFRSLEAPRRAIYPWVLENATPKRIRAAVQWFRPHVVHFICHGDITAGRGWLDVQPDPNESLTRLDSVALLDALHGDGGELPTIVVLSACRTAEADDFTGESLPSDLSAMPAVPVSLASLGAELVQGGVPIVVGMSGRVSDVAARLFTRRFEGSILKGDPLVSATADARRAPFIEGRPVHQAIDWAYPMVLLADTVPPDYAPTPRDAGETDDSPVDVWVNSFRITPDDHPVFCGRQRFFDAFDELFRGTNIGALIAYAQPQTDDEDGSAKYGKTRLIEQLTFRALRAGHLPLVLSAYRRDRIPRTLPQLVDELRKQQQFAVQHLELDLPEHRLIAALGAAPWAKDVIQAAQQDAEAKRNAATTDADRERFKRYSRSVQQLRAELTDSPNQLSTKAIALALQYDLWQLAEAFRTRLDQLRRRRVEAKKPVDRYLVHPDRARAVVLLDNLDQYDQKFVDEFFDMVNQGGLGAPEDPIPLVAAFTLDDGPPATLLRPFVEHPKPHVTVLPLEPFARGEDMLVYQRVLLNPKGKPLAFANFSLAHPWVLADSVDRLLAAECEEYFHFALRGRPALLKGRQLFTVARDAYDKKYLIEADDDAMLRDMGLIT
jgi:hypothetical protein